LRVVSDIREKEMGTHSSILSWRIPWAKEPGGMEPPWKKEYMPNSTSFPVLPTLVGRSEVN
jgi:hypothetical protein